MILAGYLFVGQTNKDSSLTVESTCAKWTII